jgi:hypothetical protein
MKRYLSFSLLGLLSFTACSKDKDDTITLTESSIAGRFVVINVTALTGTVERDVTEFFMMDCEKDDVITLNKNNTFKVTDEGIVCTPPTDEEGAWSLPGNGKIDIDGEVMKVTKWDGIELHFNRQERIDDKDAVVTFKLRKTR